MKNTNKEKLEAIRGTIAFFLYFLLSYGAAVPFAILKIDYNSLSLTFKQIYLVFYNLFMVSIFILIYRNDLKKEWLDFKNNYKAYFKGYFKYWLFALAIMYASNLIIGMIKYSTTGTITSAENEELIRQTLAKAPIYTFIAVSICAPIMEELTFRKSLRKIYNNKIIFIIVSSFIFGALHVFTEGMTSLDLLYLIPYCAPGFAFAYILVKTDNIFNTISLHLLHNSILMILQIVLLFRGIL